MPKKATTDLQPCRVTIDRGTFSRREQYEVDGVCYRGLALTPDQSGAEGVLKGRWRITHVNTGLLVPLPTVKDGRTQDITFSSAKTGTAMLRRLGDAYSWDRLSDDDPVDEAMKVVLRVTGYVRPEAEQRKLEELSKRLGSKSR